MFGNYEERISDMIKSVLLSENPLLNKSQNLLMLINHYGIDVHRTDVMAELEKLNANLFNMEYIQNFQELLKDIQRRNHRVYREDIPSKNRGMDPKPYLKVMETIRAEINARLPNYSLLMAYLTEKVNANHRKDILNKNEDIFWGSDEKADEIMEGMLKIDENFLDSSEEIKS